MFATLTRPLPTTAMTSAWLNRRRPMPGGVLTRLAPGVYIVRSKQWLPATALDAYAELPSPELPELAPRRFPYPEWHKHAACRELPQKLFFGDGDGVRPALRRSVLARARGHCLPCPVRRDCLTWALEQPEKYGIWGGTSGRDRKRLQALIRSGSSIELLVEGVLSGQALT